MPKNKDEVFYRLFHFALYNVVQKAVATDRMFMMEYNKCFIRPNNTNPTTLVNGINVALGRMGFKQC